MRAIKENKYEEIYLKVEVKTEFKTIFNELEEAIFIYENNKLQNIN